MKNTLIHLSKFNPPTTLFPQTHNSLAFDETENYFSNNRVFSVLLGDAVPQAKRGSKDGTEYNHYSIMATVEKNWELGDLGKHDAKAVPFY